MSETPIAAATTRKTEIMLQNLPEDLQVKLLSLLRQREIACLSSSCKTFNKLAYPLLQRTFRCVSCSQPLLHPRDMLPLPRESRPRRAFFELQQDATHQLRIDQRRGAANFHVLRHLRQTVFRNIRFPLPEELQAVSALRCPKCDVFVGFRHDGVTGIAHEYIHQAFVELIDGSHRLITLNGEHIGHKESISRCANSDCKVQLFECDDILPWTHVLSSKRLTDMNPYLEWDHSWAGAATASHPAFFVKRLKVGSFRLCNVRVEQLRQGVMQVGDVQCSGCNNHIGWKIIAEVPESKDGLLHNYDQIGRFGITRNAVTPSQPLPNIIV